MQSKILSLNDTTPSGDQKPANKHHPNPQLIEQVFFFLEFRKQETMINFVIITIII